MGLEVAFVLRAVWRHTLSVKFMILGLPDYL